MTAPQRVASVAAVLRNRFRTGGVLAAPALLLLALIPIGAGDGAARAAAADPPPALSPADLPRLTELHVADSTPPALRRRLDAAVREAATCDRMWGLLALHRGEPAVEAYFNGMRATTPINLKSVTKSLNSAMVGAALDRGLIGSVDDPVAAYLPDAFAGHPDKSAVTVRHLLTMSSGLPVVPYGAFQRAPSWVGVLLAGPLRHRPGERHQYDTPHTHLLTALVAAASGTSAREFADATLLQPLGGEVADWRRGPQGIEMGGNDCYLRPRDLIRFGELYRRGGTWEERRVLSAEWVAASLTKQINLPKPTVNHGTLDATGYGYLWWLLDFDGEAAFAALGHGGQELVVCPDRELVILLTSRWRGPSSTEHYRHLASLIRDHLLPAFPRS